MNHYHVNGQKRLFVAMTKDGRCIVEEGADDKYLWNRLWRKATQPVLPPPLGLSNEQVREIFDEHAVKGGSRNIHKQQG